jgi:sterol desaturase/sphingolipid hydroxylase (fatty acid hydroxylase superfamily)
VVDKHTIAVFLVGPFFIVFVFSVRALIFTTLEKVWPAQPHSYRATIVNDVTATATYIWLVVPIAMYLNRFVLGGYHPFPFDVEAIPIPLRVALYLAGADFGYYWIHRLMHTRDVWRVHMWHHSPPFLYWLAGMRATVPQQFLVNFAYILMYPMLGDIPWWLSLAIAHHVGFKNDWQHMNVAWPSRWLEWVFVTPRYHQIHHSTSPDHYERNLGDLLTVWDRLFGTYVDPGRVKRPLSFGIDSRPHPVRLVLGV